MARDTARDQAWDHALRTVLDGKAINAVSLAAAAGVSERTAADTLRTMTEYDWLTQEGGKGPERAEYHAGDRLPNNLTSYTTETQQESD